MGENLQADGCLEVGIGEGASVDGTLYLNGEQLPVYDVRLGHAGPVEAVKLWQLIVNARQLVIDGGGSRSRAVEFVRRAVVDAFGDYPLTVVNKSGETWSLNGVIETPGSAGH